MDHPYSLFSLFLVEEIFENINNPTNIYAQLDGAIGGKSKKNQGIQVNHG